MFANQKRRSATEAEKRRTERAKSDERPNNYPKVNRSVLLENYQTRMRNAWQSSNDNMRYQWQYGNNAMMDMMVQKWVDDPASNFGISIESVTTQTGYDKIRTSFCKATRHCQTQALAPTSDKYREAYTPFYGSLSGP